jgi:hypothetical protein
MPLSFVAAFVAAFFGGRFPFETLPTALMVVFGFSLVAFSLFRATGKKITQ